MKSIIHDWNDERCSRTLQTCHSALKRRARLTVIDRIVPEMLEPKADHLSAVLSDLNMLRGPGGCEWTESEHRESARQERLSDQVVRASGLALSMRQRLRDIFAE